MNIFIGHLFLHDIELNEYYETVDITIIKKRCILNNTNNIINIRNILNQRKSSEFYLYSDIDNIIDKNIIHSDNV